ncbi:L-lysine 2-3-aminomutase [Penicillium psychrosexuale]|uniref:L-lysine 2-3-aminomutase n=1 Tax=Penicillium psychrosexuale TaxID=1002107 RepID=UPI00254591C6|nr:L-lysine 2-3-aminomutase [Penicillium psychrosexuale]KAJ5801684.1 L-lysine 2-3-aminomutase [Penicillium psychrosexuale]
MQTQRYAHLLKSYAISTYDHRVWKTGLPVRSAVLKPHAGELVVGWVTTSESSLFSRTGRYFFTEISNPDIRAGYYISILYTIVLSYSIFLSCTMSHTYDHRVWKIGLPVRSAVLKPHAGELVVGWVTTSESSLLWMLRVYWIGYLFWQVYKVAARKDQWEDV